MSRPVCRLDGSTAIAPRISWASWRLCCCCCSRPLLPLPPPLILLPSSADGLRSTARCSRTPTELTPPAAEDLLSGDGCGRSDAAAISSSAEACSCAKPIAVATRPHSALSDAAARSFATGKEEEPPAVLLPLPPALPRVDDLDGDINGCSRCVDRLSLF